MSNNGGIRRGVAIILSPEFSVAYQKAGRQKNSSSQNSIFAGRYLGISLNFPTISNYGKAIKRTTKVYIASIYHPWEEETYDAFNDYAIELLAECPDNSIKIIGHDLNASVGIKTPRDNGTLDEVLGTFSLNNRNEKGLSALSFLQQMSLKVMTTFFSNKSYVTHTSNFNRDDEPIKLTLDSISVSKSGSNRVHNCKVWNLGVESDHSAILMKFSLTSIKFNTKSKELNQGEIDWDSIRYDSDLNTTFNQKLRELHHPNLSYAELGPNIMSAGLSTATKLKDFTPSWYEDDKENLQPPCDKRASICNEIRSCSDPVKRIELTEERKLIRKECQDQIEIAKCKWADKLGVKTNGCRKLEARKLN
jgi:hypothetical protein